jgi:uncharacterized protein (DUF983 family)
MTAQELAEARTDPRVATASTGIPTTCPTCGPGWAKITRWQRHDIRILPDCREVRYDCGHEATFPPP